MLEGRDAESMSMEFQVCLTSASCVLLHFLLHYNYSFFQVCSRLIARTR